MVEQALVSALLHGGDLQISKYGPRCIVDWFTDGLTGLTVLHSSTSKGGMDSNW